jgi:pimeloyl-ACP methyl ester carboxylesterase
MLPGDGTFRPPVTAVFVHGCPETDAIWAPLLEAIAGQDVVCLSPPGFGAPLPEGWPATFLSYRDWLIGELTRFEEPVDLVGHDWGGAHVVNVVMDRPELVRTWATDAVGVFDADYVWHDLARVWQTPGAGEAEVEQRVAQAAQSDAVQFYVHQGFSEDVAADVSGGMGFDMGRAILALYRSAAQPALAQAGAGLERAAVKPGLSLLATEDVYVGSEHMRRRAARRAGARTEVLDGLGHWWMGQDPARGAAALRRFWESAA